MDTDSIWTGRRSVDCILIYIQTGFFLLMNAFAPIWRGKFPRGFYPSVIPGSDQFLMASLLCLILCCKNSFLLNNNSRELNRCLRAPFLRKHLIEWDFCFFSYFKSRSKKKETSRKETDASWTPVCRKKRSWQFLDHSGQNNPEKRTNFQTNNLRRK